MEGALRPLAPAQPPPLLPLRSRGCGEGRSWRCGEQEEQRRMITRWGYGYQWLLVKKGMEWGRGWMEKLLEFSPFR
jgi:hypothetical protein